MKKNIPKINAERKYILSFKLTYFLLIVCPLLLLSTLSCSDKEDSLRSEYIFITTMPDGEEYKDHFVADLNGDEASIYIHANVDYEVTFQTGDDKNRNWIKIGDLEATADPAIKKMNIKVAPKSKTNWKERIGSIALTSKENHLARFIEIRQGYPHRVDEEFTWLVYGTTSPLDGAKEVSIEKWNAQEKEKGWSSTTPAITYGKNGYVKLGDGLARADISTPFVNQIKNDSILIVSFDALAYTNQAGVKDGNKLKVRITGGGVFSSTTPDADPETLTNEKLVELKYYDISSENLGVSMWDIPNNRYFFRIESTEKSKLSSSTRIQFVGGDGDEFNRVFIDNVQLFVVNRMHKYMLNK